MTLYFNQKDLDKFEEAYLMKSRSDLNRFKKALSDFNYLATITWKNEPTEFPCFVTFTEKETDMEQYRVKFKFWAVTGERNA